MAFSVEARVPFLDHRIVEFVFGRAAHLSLRDGWTKWIHRAGMSVDDRLPPDVTWRRDKIGFATPESRWVTESGPQLREIFASAGGAADFIDVGRLALSAESLAKADPGLVWRYAALTVWLRRFSELYA